LPGKGEIEYAVINIEGQLLTATRDNISTNLHDAMVHGDTVTDITSDGEVIGKVLFSNDINAQWQDYLFDLRIIIILAFLALALIVLLTYLFIYIRILKPFGQMKDFARRVAAGNLDIPLEMYKKNAFGAYTESFDLMRDELKRARENEIAAEKSKRDLIASVSHDIQSPVTSIRAVAELMEVKTVDESQRQKLQIIQEKTEQIHTLLADLFGMALENHRPLNVKLVALNSNRLEEIIRNSDYRGLTKIQKIPSCLLRVDPTRLAQVIDNIIINSYKYANTNIDVSVDIDSRGMALTFRDYGPGVDPDELSMVSLRYFRGKSIQSDNGYGLGLYIAESLVERMGGEIEYFNADPGFAVEIWLRFDEQ
jgi:signal transduction histidine kinase